MLGPENKKMVLTSAASKWREFKSRLTSNYIVPFKDDSDMLQFPPDDYGFIRPDHWTAFVAKRTSKTFLVCCIYRLSINTTLIIINLIYLILQELRKAKQITRYKNKYPHRMSRKGYAGLEEELVSFDILFS